MTIIQSIILGIVEGATEFLPVSSTAHLIVAQKLMGLGDVSEFFTTVVQLGAIAGLIWAEKRTLFQILSEFFASLRKKQHTVYDIQHTRAILLLIASLPVLVIGFLVKDSVSALQNNIPLIAFMSIAIAVVLFIAERYSRRFSGSHQSLVTSRQLFVMGIFQVIAIIPGTSRSGVTAAGGAFQKMSLSQALEWSFLLAIPALCAAGGYEVLKAVKSGADHALFLPTAIGTFVAFVTAILAINWLRKIVREKGFTPFVIYRIIFGIAILFLV